MLSQVHLEKRPLADDINEDSLGRLAFQTQQFVGASLANLGNIASLPPPPPPNTTHTPCTMHSPQIDICVQASLSQAGQLLQGHVNSAVQGKTIMLHVSGLVWILACLSCGLEHHHQKAITWALTGLARSHVVSAV